MNFPCCTQVASQGQWLSGIRASERMHHAWAQALSRSHGSSRAGSGSSGGGGQSDGIDEEGGSVAACPRTLASSYGRSLWVPMAGGKAGAHPILLFLNHAYEAHICVSRYACIPKHSIVLPTA